MLEFEYSTEREAELVARLLEIDNRVGNIDIKTHAEGKKVITVLEHEKTGTFIATIEDLLFTERLISNLLEL